MKLVFVFVEGDADRRFIENLIQPYFLINKQLNIQVIPYQIKVNKRIKKTIDSFLAKDHNFIFLSDLDSHSYPCISSRKEKRHNEYSSLPLNRIVIVKEEIESWYIAGIDNSNKKFKKWDVPYNTDKITKEEFEELMKINNFNSRIDFFNEIINYYDLDMAIERNDSLKYFIEKLDNLCYS